MKRQIFLKALVYTILVVVISACLTIYFYKDERRVCEKDYTELSQKITLKENSPFYCSTLELIKSDFKDQTKLGLAQIRLEEEKVKNQQNLNDLKENVKMASVFNQEQTPFSILEKNLKKEGKVDVQNAKIEVLNKNLVNQTLPFLQSLEQKKSSLIQIQKEYHSLEEISSFWKNFIAPAKNLEKINVENIKSEEVDSINKMWGSWYNILKTELNTLAIISADKFNESLPFKFYSDDDFIRTVGNIDFTKIDSELQKYGVYDTNYEILDGGVGDKAIRDAAKVKGFQNHTLADKSKMVTTDRDILLNPAAAKAYEAMKEAAKKDGVEFILSSGYRDFKEQEDIFLPRLQTECQKVLARDCTGDDLVGGKNPEILNELLKVTAPPGFSRHHSGHTLDLNDLQITDIAFADTPSYRWLSQNNFLNAKRFGFLPSYPAVKGGFNYGPEPEPWEYVYVGDEFTKSGLFIDGNVVK